MIKNINFKFFKKRVAIVLVTTSIIGASIVAGEYNIFKKNKNYYGQYNGSDQPKYEDRIVYDNYIPNNTTISGFTYYASNEYKYKIFKGLSKCSHYRIEIKGTEPLECSKWIEIPNDGLITINRSNFSDNQYGHDFIIRFGIYDSNKNEIIDKYNENNVIFASNCSKEDIEKNEKIKNKLLEAVKKIIKQEDTEFYKVKKTYDYIIKNIAYNFNSINTVNLTISNFGKYYTDCAGYTDILNYIFNNIGIESFSSVDNTNGHIWNIVKVDGRYYHLDATYSDTGSWDATSKYRYFLVSDDFMLDEGRFFIKEKDVTCDNMYNLTDYNIREQDLKYRTF